MSIFKWQERDFPSPVYSGSNVDKSCKAETGLWTSVDML